MLELNSIQMKKLLKNIEGLSQKESSQNYEKGHISKAEVPLRKFIGRERIVFSRKSKFLVQVVMLNEGISRILFF